jgi:hypothetical protein
MLIGSRAASIPIQIVALLLGIVGGWLLYTTVVGVLGLILPDVLSLPILFICVAFCAYFLAAPATWLGVARRGLLVVAVCLLGYAVIGYLLAFLFLRGIPLRGTMPSWQLSVQAGIVLVGAGALAGFLLLRGRNKADILESATVAASENAMPSAPTDTQG